MYDLRAFQPGERLFRLWLVACCLVGFFQVAHAAKLVDFSRAGVNTSGNTAKIGMTGTAGTAWGSTIPISPTVGGWSQAGNYGIPSAAKGPTMTMGGNGDVFFAGTKYPFQAGYTVPASNVWAGLKDAALTVGGLAGGPVGLALIAASTAAPYIKQWMDDANLRAKPDGSGIQKGDDWYCTASCYEYRGFTGLPWDRSPEAACRAHAAYYSSTYVYNTIVDLGGGAYQCREQWKSGGANNWFTLLRQARAADTAKTWVDLSGLDDIGPYLTPRNFDPRVVPEILAKGGDIPMPSPTITGPTALPGPSTTVKNPDGSTTVTQNSYTFTISGDTITNVTNISSTTIYNSSSQVISTSTSTITASPNKMEQVPDLCKVNPDSVACASKKYLDDLMTKLDQLIAKKTDCERTPDAAGCRELGDIPTDTIPKSTIALSYSPENHFGGGSCPSNKSMTLHGGPTVVVANWDVVCDQVTTYVRPLLLVLAAFGALMVLAPGLRDGAA